MGRLRHGGISNDEKRQMEQLIPFHTYEYVAKKLNRDASTVRKWCQRNGLTKDSTSVKKFAKARILENKHFSELENQLTDNELELSYSIYEELMKQFGGDITYSEECQVIDYAVTACLLNRSLAREKFLIEKMEEQQKDRERLDTARLKAVEQKDEDKQEELYEKIEIIDLRIEDFRAESIAVKKQQLELMKAKKEATKSINGSREQRAKDLNKINENFSDLVLYTQKNPHFRTGLGLELTKMNLGMKSEYVRLTDLHTYSDGDIDLPIMNIESVSRIEYEE